MLSCETFLYSRRIIHYYPIIKYEVNTTNSWLSKHRRLNIAWNVPRIIYISGNDKGEKYELNTECVRLCKHQRLNSGKWATKGVWNHLCLLQLSHHISNVNFGINLGSCSLYNPPDRNRKQVSALNALTTYWKHFVAKNRNTKKTSKINDST